MLPPVLLRGRTLNPAEPLRPSQLSLSLKIDSFSTASMVLPLSGTVPDVGDWVKFIAPNGETVIMSVKSVAADYTAATASVSCEHVFALLQEMIMFGEYEPSDLGGSGDTVRIDTAMRAILSHQDPVIFEFRECDFSNSEGWKIQNSDLYAALRTLTDTVSDCQFEFDFSDTPFGISLKRWPESASMEMRGNRNLSTLKRTVDRGSMYTRVYPIGNKNLKLPEEYIDRNTADFGVISQVIQDNSIYDAGTLRAWANKMLKKNAQPAVTVSISGLELSQDTGEPFDRLRLGRICRVPLPEYGTTVTERLSELTWRDCVADEYAVTVTLANELKTVESVLFERAEGGGPAGRKGGGGTSGGADMNFLDDKINEFDDSEIWVNRDSIWAVCGAYDVIVDDDGTRHIVLKQGSLLEQTREGITMSVFDRLDEDGNWINDFEASQIYQKKDEIVLKVGKFNLSDDGTKLTLQNGTTFRLYQDGAVLNVGQTVKENNTFLNNFQGTSLYQNRDGIAAKCGKLNLSSDGKHITVVSGTDFRVTRNGVSSTVVDKGNVLSSINQSGEEVTINASKINLTGYVKATQLSAVDAKIDNLKSGVTIAQALNSVNTSVSTNFQYRGHIAYWKDTGEGYHVLAY